MNARRAMWTIYGERVASLLNRVFRYGSADFTGI
jgi:hypothetical protein